MDQLKLNGALERFEAAGKPTVSSFQAVSATATGLIFLTGLIADLSNQIEALRSEVHALREDLNSRPPASP